MQMTAPDAEHPSSLPPAGAARPASLTDDAFLGGRLRLLQPEKGYRAGIDSVFLAAAVPCEPGDRLYEAGIGTGVAALCVLARTAQVQVTGIEMQARHVMLCEENARRNGFGPQVRVIHADIREALRKDLVNMPAHGSFAHAFANPPYYEEDKSTASPQLIKAKAHAFGSDDLDLWIKVLHTMVAPRGTVTVVYRAEGLNKLLAAMDQRCGDLRIAPLHARADSAASRVIVQGVKGSRAPLRLLPGFVLHDEGSTFTPQAEAVLRDGMAWRLR